MNEAIKCCNAVSKIVPILFFVLLISISCLPALSTACPQITTTEASQQMAILANEIRYHNRLYYEQAQPAISDSEYDKLFARLVLLEGCFPALVVKDSPTSRVGSGGVSAETRLVEHEQPMLSLSSSTSPEAVAILLKRVEPAGEAHLLVQPKVDGLPVELVYNAGRLVSASTRGDGRAGEVVTERIREIQGVPQQLSGTFPDKVVVRGEIYADLQLLQDYRMGAATERYATPRHMAAGVLKAQKQDPAAVAVLRLFPFELVTAGSVTTDLAALQLLLDWGFPVASKHTVVVRTFADIQAVYRDCLARRAQQPFAMDGIVVKVDDLQLRQQLGAGARAPFWAAAWKFPPDTALTRVREIAWTVGRSGRRTPVVEVVPVFLGGVQVSHFSLHNNAELARLDIAPGDQVVVELVGDVIPQLLEVAGRVPRKVAAVPTRRQVPKTALDMCLKDSVGCREQFTAKAAYFTSKSGLGIAGLGKGRLKKLVEAGLVSDLPSLFLLNADAVAAVPGFGVETALRLTSAIRDAAHPDSFRLVTALGINGVGPRSLQHLARQFASLDALLAAEEEQLTVLTARDSCAARTVRSFFHSPGGEELLVKFRELGVL
ncbi:MAG: NAD-dependent DNA ligase LigA [Desulfuromonadaceae bacterium]|nr:NAD-dependent DNA ligase LigA [Desulfuromonadaceae bacterium]MDD2847006.1 NAD-dependent DNA ligase LigA [Desulfuromonadaceae bacterium]MDD4129016.1 NAD-dependent DNA ligase LigA [Desulfuromonadaceae bacterium]